MRRIALIVAPLIVVLAVNAVLAQTWAPAPELGNGCEWAADQGWLRCPIRVGRQSFLIRPIGQSAAPFNELFILRNNSGLYRQINIVRIGNADQTAWKEVCVNSETLNSFPCTTPPYEYCPPSGYSPGQANVPGPGKGEVGCMTQMPGEAYPALHWDSNNYGRGLTVFPNSEVYFGNNWGQAPNEPVLFVVDVAEATTGIISYRQPKLDNTIPCDGLNQMTALDPWINPISSTQRWWLDGATIYAATGLNSASVTSACVAIIRSSDGWVKWQYCSGLNTRGAVAFPMQSVDPGYYLQARASNTCSTGFWDWAAYFHVFYGSFP